MIGPGERLASFALPTESGQLRRWEPGRPSVVSIVALWCDTWKEQSARLAHLRTALHGTPTEFLSVSIDGRWRERATEGALGTLLLDAGGVWSRSLGIQAVPFTLVLDASGIVRHAGMGIARAATIREALAQKSERRTGRLFLTFDDFPQRDDDLLLDILRRFDVRASFFCLGEHLAEATGTALARRAIVEGHTLEVHSWDHDIRRPQLARTVAALEKLGSRPALYRPPGRAEVRRLLGGEQVSAPLPLAHVTPFDDTRPGEAELRRRLLLGLRPETVYLLHAGIAETRAVLPELLQRVRTRGWSLSPLSGPKK